MKVTDVGCAVHVCSLIVQRYSEFSGLLLEALQKQFGGGISKGEDKVASQGHRGCRTSKSSLEMFCESLISSLCLLPFPFPSPFPPLTSPSPLLPSPHLPLFSPHPTLPSPPLTPPFPLLPSPTLPSPFTLPLPLFPLPYSCCSGSQSAVVSRYRLGLRLVAELVVSGVVHDQEAGLNLLSRMLADIFGADKVHKLLTVMSTAQCWVQWLGLQSVYLFVRM